MRRVLSAASIVVAVVLLLALLAPLVPLPGTVPPEQLVGPDGRFLEADGIDVHYQEYGEDRTAVLLLHGFGASTFSWREVTAPLAERYRVIAFDRPGFGISERPLPGTWSDTNPYGLEGQARLTIALMDALGIDEAVLVGHSAGGAVALKVAMFAPDRVAGLVLVSAAVYEDGPPSWARSVAHLPVLERLGPLAMRSIALFGDRAVASAWHDPSRVTPEVLNGYRAPLRCTHWDVALWELVRAYRPSDLPSSLGVVRRPALVVYGTHDTWVAPALSQRLAEELPKAAAVAIEDCGHLPQEEQPGAFLDAVVPFLEALPASGAG